jgi:hypothetical protein
LEDLKKSKEELIVLKEQLAKLQKDLEAATLYSKSQEELIARVNESFEKYSKETKAKINSLKFESTLWKVIGGVAVGAAIYSFGKNK